MGSGGPPGGLGGVKWPIRMSRKGQEADPVVSKRSVGPHRRPGDPLGGSRGIGRPTQTFGRGWEAPRGFGRGRDAHPKVWEGLEGPP